jgi:hypothetical protein
MKNLEFYKPQKSGNGTCANFRLVQDNEDSKKNGFYASILKQYSWNDQTKTASFKENKDNPEKHKKIKLNDTEIANILYIIESQGKEKFSTVHKNGSNTTPIFFEPYIRNDVFSGFVFRISSLGIAFNFPEAIKIREYLKLVLEKMYSDNKLNEEKKDTLSI